MVLVQSTLKAEFGFLECNAIHVPVQCTPDVAVGAWFKSSCFHLVRQSVLCTTLGFLNAVLHILVHAFVWC
jgi:hypothetical protein